MATSGKKIPESLVRSIVRMLRSGASLRNVAATLGVSTTTVARVKATNLAK